VVVESSLIPFVIGAAYVLLTFQASQAGLLAQVGSSGRARAPPPIRTRPHARGWLNLARPAARLPFPTRAAQAPLADAAAPCFSHAAAGSDMPWGLRRG